jgi:surfeit locus 1 family protein
LVVNQTSLDLYDGYIIADSEFGITRTRISPPAPKSAIPGFYWQHVSYVIIWWLMAGIVLYLPFYQRRVSPDKELKEELKESEL